MEFLTLPVIRPGSEDATDLVVVEEPLEILINGRNLAITMRTPGNDEELAIGFLFTEGLIKSADEILSISGAGNQVNVELANPPEVERRLTMTSACGVCGKASIDSLYANGCQAVPRGGFAISSETLRKLPEILRDAQTIFHQTGGLHGAGLFDAEGHLELIREDVGRHNAVDKLIGARLLGPQTATVLPQTAPLNTRTVPPAAQTEIAVSQIARSQTAIALSQTAPATPPQTATPVTQTASTPSRDCKGAVAQSLNPPPSNSVLLVSGRASFELIQKAAMARIPMLAAVGAPSTLAVETAQRFNLTLVGFLRHDRFNIYTGPERIS